MQIQYLEQGERRNLSNEKNSNIGKISIGIRLSSKEMDIHTVVDIAVICKSNTKGIYTIWYGNPHDESNSIFDDTDHCNGSSWNDDDLRVSIDFEKLPSDIEKMSIVTNILWGAELNQHYGMIENGYLHVYSHDKNTDIIQQNIKWLEHKERNGMIWAEIYPYKNSWKIRAIEESVTSKDLGDLVKVAGSYL